ncbi:MAG: ATP synthase F0 subunit B [Candidatus Marinimicrobia bacterium]|nr:ATP synthase F0 subunit B [Candidatus Neomarinimicrobiota bacterium]|tara:strand:+ start:211 stop:786 length:576 start_codon:yes stop_codon:yes gene_type:complete
MNKVKYFIYINSFTFLLAGGDGGGSWINDWLMPNTGLTLWTIATFLVLLFVLKWKAWGPLMDALDARSKQIEESLSKAEKVTAEAEEQAAKNEEILQAARKEAQNIVAQAREAGDKLKHKMETDGKEQYDGMVEKAKEQIDMEKQKALSEIKTTVVDIALKASEKVVKRNLTNEDNKKIVEQTVEEFKQAN